MGTYKQIEQDINRVKDRDEEAGSRLHDQMHRAQNEQWTFDELSDMLKGDNDVADNYFSENEQLHFDVRNIQDAIINFYSHW